MAFHSITYTQGFIDAKKKAAKIADMSPELWREYLLKNSGKGKKLVAMNKFIARKIRAIKI